jgi:hypothetical protein
MRGAGGFARRSRADSMFLVKGLRDQGSRARPQEAKAAAAVAEGWRVGGLEGSNTENPR